MLFCQMKVIPENKVQASLTVENIVLMHGQGLSGNLLKEEAVRNRSGFIHGSTPKLYLEFS